MTIYDLAHVHAGLKDFQRASVEHASRMLFGGEGTGRFLVADEVGLGKTMVARGVIARCIEHHVAEGTDRIDVVYICSNGSIAEQNIRRLNVLDGHEFSFSSRLTFLPRQLRQLQGQRLNFVSFTPGTSFNLRSAEGVVDERALIHNMLQELWGGVVEWGEHSHKVFAGTAGYSAIGHRITDPRNQHFDASLLRAFGEELRAVDGREGSLQLAYGELYAELGRFGGTSGTEPPWELRQQRRKFIGTLRELLAHACVEALEPDLVILDEFQRFKNLFDPEDDAGALARSLFSYRDVAVLLLSATPYKMYTQADEGEDHYEDFIRTAAFLLRDDQQAVDRLRSNIAEFRRTLFELGPATMHEAMRSRSAIESTLQRIMSRHERLAATENRSGMLAEVTPPSLSLEADDVRSYVAMDRLGQRVGAHGGDRYWEATPYPVSFMQGYVFSNRVHELLEREPGAVEELGLDRLSLDFDDIERYRRTDPGNARMRSLEADVLDRRLWSLLWLPPSLPYYEPSGAFAEVGQATKRLIFSAWGVVPNAVAAYITYEAERRMMRAAGHDPDELDPELPLPNTAAGRLRVARRLEFTTSRERLTGMRVLALLYPSVVLADLGDPLAIAREHGALAKPMSQEGVIEEVRAQIEDALAPLVAGAPRDGRIDQDWYWAAPFLLDHRSGEVDVTGWLDDPATAAAMRDGYGTGPDGTRSQLDDHLAEASRAVAGGLSLGRTPDDLGLVLAEMAVAGPAVVALRALTRDGGRELHSSEVRRAAAAVAWGLRSQFNDPVVTSMIASGAEGARAEDAYWRLVLGYCLDGGLQSVFDEWTHVLTGSLGVGGRGEEALEPLTGAMRTALMAQSVNYRVTRVDVRGDVVDLSQESMRASFARRFGDGRAETESTLQTAANVREAFNSPFWPFVLASTSVGQEGLDFHTYCHAVVHWNLPHNPVDLEQREGRVHRFKGHAVRRNLAAEHRADGIAADGDPWEAMFNEASEHREDHADELVPFWVYAPPGSTARIERYVPALPLSREAAKLEELRKSTAAYRLVFGQPRQEDLIHLLDRQATDGIDLDALRIDLRPAPVAGPPPASIEVDLSLLEDDSADGVATVIADDDEEFLAWRSTHRSGYIMTTPRDHAPSGTVLHRATCVHLGATAPNKGTWTSGSYVKVVASTVAALDDWALRAAGGVSARCGACQPPAASGSRQPRQPTVGTKYRPLYDHLATAVAEEWTATFDEVEAVIGASLPPSAHRHDAWWSNNPHDHPHSHSWLVAGFRTEGLDLARRQVSFIRDEELSAPVASSVRTGDGLSERHHLRRQFWTQLLQRARTRTGLHANRSPSTENWIGTGAGVSGLEYNYVITQHSARVELYVDHGVAEANDATYDRLFRNRAAVEEVFGEPLDWQLLPDKRACRVNYDVIGVGYRDEERWPSAHDAMIDAMVRLERALSPYVRPRLS